MVADVPSRRSALWRALLVFAGLLATSAANAEDEAFQAAKAGAAHISTIARAAPLLCPWIKADEEAIRALMEHAHITDRDIMDPERFGIDDEEIARSFALSVREDPDFCAKTFLYLGERTHLLRRKLGTQD